MPLRTRKREHTRRRHARDLTTRNHFATHQGTFTYASVPGRTRRPDRDVRNGHPNCRALDHAHLRKHGLGMRSANALLAHRTTQLLQEAHLGAPSKNRLAKCNRKRNNTMHQTPTKTTEPQATPTYASMPLGCARHVEIKPAQQRRPPPLQNSRLWGHRMPSKPSRHFKPKRNSKGNLARAPPPESSKWCCGVLPA